MSSSSNPDFSAILESDERLVWSGGPNREVMLKTMGKNKKRNYSFLLVLAAFIFVFGFLNQGQIGGLMAGDPTESLTLESLTPFLLGAVLLVGTLTFIFQVNARKSRRYVDSLAYAITNRRALIVYGDGKIDSFSPTELKEAKVEERMGAEGYYDIVWGSRGLPSGTDGKAERNPLNWERTRIGFKALRDGPDIMARIERLQRGQS